MSGKYLNRRPSTSSVGTPSCVTVTHPFHPLRGQKLELVHVPRKANSKLSVRHPEGRCFRIPRDWTDFEIQQDEQSPAPLDRLLDINGLRAVAGIISNLKTEIPPPEGGGEGDA
jgi:Family of unknown function (DUF5372)